MCAGMHAHHRMATSKTYFVFVHRKESGSGMFTSYIAGKGKRLGYTD